MLYFDKCYSVRIEDTMPGRHIIMLVIVIYFTLLDTLLIILTCPAPGSSPVNCPCHRS